jgi:hypothetical protein
MGGCWNMVGVGANCWYAYAVETNHGGGVGGTRASPTAPTNGTLTGPSYTYDEGEIPYEYFEREARHAMGLAANTRVIINTKLERPTFVIRQCVQARLWIDHAVVLAAGGCPDSSKSYVFHFENGAEYYNVYGCYIVKYRLIAKVGSIIYEELTFAFDKVATGSALTKVVPITQAPLTWKDVAEPTLGGTAFVDAEEITLEFINEFSQRDTFSSWRGTLPYLDSREINIWITGHANVNSKVETFATEALTPFDVVLGNIVNAAGTAKDVTITNMKIGKDSKFNHLPEKGFIDYKFHLDIGGASAITVEA